MEKSRPVQKTVVLEPFIKLVRLVARAFYDDYTTKSDNQQKSARSDNRGIAVVVLDALTRRQWVREEDLAKELKLHAKQLRKIIRHFEEQKLIMRDHRKETAKGAKNYSVAVAATTDGRAEDKVKFHTHSYCCLDYSQIYDVVRFKLHKMKKKLNDELEDKNTVQEYVCPNCQRKYNALDAPRLISMVDDSFHCENCNGELVVECNKLTSEVVDGDDNGRRRRREKLRDMLQKMEVQMKPVMEQINRVKDLPVPDFGSLLAWEARAAMAARENGNLNPDDPLRSQGGYSSTPMPFLGETKVEVNLGEGKEDVKSNGGDSSLKVLPPWMIKQGMNLTEEQRGEMRHESKVDVGSGASQVSDDKKSAMENGDDKDLKDEYLKAYYYAAILKQQELAAKQNQQESAGEVAPDIQLASISSDRQVGAKFKHEEEDEEDFEWEEAAPVTVAGNGNYKVDLNVEAEASDGEEEEDDDIWEEGWKANGSNIDH